MAKLASLDLSDNHPLALELTSLRNTVARFQDEAHTASIKLQRHSLDTARAHDRFSLLEHENNVLRKELAVLRALPHPNSSPDFHPAVSQVRQLTVSLRELSDKLSRAEEVLATRTKELAHASGETRRAKYLTDSAYDLLGRMRGRDEADSARERELRSNLRAAEERLKLADLVTKEYADLVRSLESKLAARSQEALGRVAVSAAGKDTRLNAGSNHYEVTLEGSFERGKSSLQKLLSEFSEEEERLQAEILQLHNELDLSRAQLEAQNKGIEEERAELARTKTELQQLKMDDNTAAKMVSRYMKFSQTSTDALQSAISSLKARHAATADSLSTQISSLTAQLQYADMTTERLRAALDDLGGDYMKESYGRRREVALRIKLISREESLMEGLRRWVLRGQEALARTLDAPADEALQNMVDEAKSILSSNDGPIHDPPPGPLARVIAARTAADGLAQELHVETARRLELQRLLVLGRQEEPGPVINVDDYQEVGTQYEASTSSVAVQASILAKTVPSGLPPLTDGSLSVDPVSSNPRQLATTSPDVPDDLRPHEVGRIQPHLTSDSGIESHEAGAVPSVTPPLHAGAEGPRLQIPLQNGQTDHPAAQSESDHKLPSADVTVKTIPATEQGVGLSATDLANDEDRSISLRDADRSPSTPKIVIARVDEGTQSIPLSAEDGKALGHGDGTSHAGGTLLVPPMILEPTAAISPIRHSSGLVLPLPLEAVEPLAAPQHTFLAQLAKIDHRYDELQRAFHDCHIALGELKESLPASSLAHAIPPDAMRMTLERLSDYVEDARVELEIRIADESLLARGYETLLSVPGALASPASGADGANPSRSEVELQVEAFITGTDPSIQKARDALTNKLSDVQHDIAVLKRTIHEQDPQDSTAQAEPSPTLSPLLDPVPASAPATSEQNGGWTAWIRGPPAPPSSSTPTFGNIMTNPRLRHSPSLSLTGSSRIGRKPYLLNGDTGSKNPLANLGLRVPVPLYVPSQAPGYPPPRSRTLSTMYMIGLGARTASGSLTSLLSPQQKVTELEPEVEDDESGEMIDVE